MSTANQPRFPSPRVTLPPVVFGIATMGNLQQVMSQQRRQAIVAAVRRLGAGPMVFDGAGKYGAGLALEGLGNALRAEGVSADEVLICNKLAWRRTPLTGPEPTFEPGAWLDLEHDAVMDLGAEGILRCHADGLALLGAPYRTDLVAVHDPDEYLAAAGGDQAERARRMDDILASYRALIALRERGVVTAVGIGAKDWKVLREIVALVDVDWVMVANSLTIMSHPPELLAWVAGLAARGVAVIDAALLHGGFLAGGAFIDYHKIDPARPAHAKALAWRARFNEVCARHGVAPIVAATSFALRVPGVASVAVGAAHEDQIAPNAAAATATMPRAFWRDLLDLGLIDRSLDFLA